MNYELNSEQNKSTRSSLQAARSLLPMLKGEMNILVYATVATIVNSALALVAPLIIAHIIDAYITKMIFTGVMPYLLLLLGLYLLGLITSYLQTRLMGGTGRRILFKLRERIFAKLQELPVAFFNANKTGDLISRINNDTDTLNQFFSQTLVQLVGSIAGMLGAAIFIIVLNVPLGLAAIAPAFAILVLTILLSPWVKRTSAAALKATGGLSAEIAESLNNFKVVVAFNRRDFFRSRFIEANDANYKAAITAGIASGSLAPVYGFASNIAQLIVLVFGIYLITTGNFTLGLLVGYLAYVNNLYSPLRQLAGLWGNMQTALAGWDRISAILEMRNEMVVLPKSGEAKPDAQASVMQFSGVSFAYVEGSEVLHNVNFTLEEGKTYALVGPTGGGKTTTASLMARLYDPTTGTVYLHGTDIRTVPIEERTKQIGFILQEPILFSGTVRENILYGNTELRGCSNDALDAIINDTGLARLLSRFEGGLDGKVAYSSDALSLGQKQLIAFMRAVLRKPSLLILDEATANIDTVTEDMLETILEKLPLTTTRVIIAHRLNTIENADEIFFINAGNIVQAGSMQHAVEMLQHGDKLS